MLTKRITGIAAILAAFMALNFAAVTESKAFTLNSTFDYTDVMKVNPPAQVAGYGAKSNQTHAVARKQHDLPQQTVTSEAVRNALNVQYKTVNQSFRITQALLDELAKSNPGLHSRIMAAQQNNLPANLTQAEARIIYALAAKTRTELAAAGDAAIWIPVIVVAIQLLMKVIDPDNKYGVHLPNILCLIEYIAAAFDRTYVVSKSCSTRP